MARCPPARGTGHEVDQLLNLGRIKTKHLADMMQYATFRRIDPPVCHGCLNLNLEEHPQQGGSPVALATKLLQHLVQGKVCFLAFLEKVNRRFFLGIIEPHLLHQTASGLDFMLRDPAVRLGDVAHHREGRGEKRRLGALEMSAEITETTIKLMANYASQKRANRTTHHEAQRAAEQFSPPSHLFIAPLNLTVHCNGGLPQRTVRQVSPGFAPSAR